MNRKLLNIAIVGTLQDEHRFAIFDEIVDRAWEEALLGEPSDVVPAGLLNIDVTKELKVFIRDRLNHIEVKMSKKDSYRDMEFRGKRNRWARG